MPLLQPLLKRVNIGQRVLNAVLLHQFVERSSLKLRSVV